MMRSLFTIIAILVWVNLSQAQQFLGYQSSNYAGITGIDYQPASATDNRYLFDMTMMGMSFTLYNNYLGINLSDTVLQLVELAARDGNKFVYNNLEIQLPSFSVQITDKDAAAFSWRVRSMFNVDGVEYEMAKLGYEEKRYPALWNQRFSNDYFSFDQMAWGEYGITYARVIKDDDEHFFKGGVTLKVLQGLFSGYIHAENAEYMFTHFDTLNIYNAEADYGHSSNFEIEPEGIKYKFVANPTVGFSFGGVYEYRPDYESFKYNMDGKTDLWMKDKNKYKVRAGFSLLDIGRLVFQKGELSNDFTADVVDWYLADNDFDNVKDFDDTLRSKFVFDDAVSEYKMNLPTTVHVHGDYNIYKDFYAGFNAFIAPKFLKDIERVHHMNTVAITPRWDHKWFGAFLPISWHEGTETNVGLTLRLGPVIAGTHNLLAFAGQKSVNDIDIHFALKIPVLYNAPKDKDGDAVSDALDECVDVPGVWEFVGCPDADKDGIADSQDDCPTDPGLKEFNGCPDKDGDKIIDSKDKCPDVAGLEKFEGCPDKDNDGIIDEEDKCPDVAGPIANEGCPYVQLHLVNEAGDTLRSVIRNDDEVFVYKNLPADESYLFRLEGDDATLYNELFVVLENDGERKLITINRANGNLFKYDYIPPKVEVIEEVPEEDVEIVLEEAQKEILKKAFDNLEFDTGKSTIRSESYSSLQELGDLLIQMENWRLKIEGHTDNVGNDQNNLILSKNRSEAVKRFLVNHGVDATRFVVNYFGETQPIATNDTQEGRQTNRRVEMTIIN